MQPWQGRPALHAPDSFETDVPHRLDRLPWSRWHSRVVAALGITWVLDGLEVTIVGALGAALTSPRTLGFSESEVGLAASAYLAGTVAIASAATTAGAAIWALRSAHFMTTFLATLPAWCNLDPLPLLTDRPRVLPREDGESLVDIAARKSPPAANPPAQEAAP